MRRVWLVTLGLLLVLATCSGPTPPPTLTPQNPVRCTPAADARFITSVDPGGRFFRDQHGDPVLVRGDSPWAGLTRWSPAQAQLWFTDRQRNGFNASLLSLIGDTANGAPSDDGATFDGILPFVDGDVTRWNPAYWQRVDTVLQTACAHGNTVFLYPVDGWTIGPIFRREGAERTRIYATMVAQRYGSLPNVVWMAGGDYFANDGDDNDVFSAMQDGLRAGGSSRPFSIQLGYWASLSTDSPYWRSRVDWNFAYTYEPTYRVLLDGYHQQPARPVLLGEANYLGENNLPGTPPTGNETLRRQALWALTSGSPGTFFGTSDWKFDPGWEARLDTPAVDQLRQIRDFFAARNWWTLVPDEGADVVTSGRRIELTRGDPTVGVLGNDWVTVARAADGSWSVAYVPAARTLSLGRGLAAAWVDPAAAARPPVPAMVGADGRVTTPGPNSDGGDDWLLLITPL